MLNVVCPHHCKDCYATLVCAVHAVKDQGQAIAIDSDSCIGCGSCKIACDAFGWNALGRKAVASLKGAA